MQIPVSTHNGSYAHHVEGKKIYRQISCVAELIQAKLQPSYSSAEPEYSKIINRLSYFGHWALFDAFEQEQSNMLLAL